MAILVTRLIDDGDIVPNAGIHGSRVAIILIGYIEVLPIRAYPGDKGHMPGRAKGPHTIGHRENGQRANARLCAYRQAKALGIYQPLRSIAPIRRQIIAKQMPHFPTPPDTIPPRRKRSRTERKRIPIGAKCKLLTLCIDRVSRMIKRRRVCRIRAKSEPDGRQKQGKSKHMKSEEHTSELQSHSDL